MAALKTKCVVGIVGGSDFPKINEQLAGEALKIGDFTFGENGLTAYKGEENLPSQACNLFLIPTHHLPRYTESADSHLFTFPFAVADNSDQEQV